MQNAAMQQRMLFPLWVKLVSIVTLLVFFALSLITILVDLFVRADISKTASLNNKSINEMSTQTTINELQMRRSNTIVALKSSLQSDNDELLFQNFFSENKSIIGFTLRRSASESESTNEFYNQKIIINTQAERSSDYKEEIFLNFIASNAHAFSENTTSSILFNAAPVFDGLPILAMSFPVTNPQGGNVLSAIIFFNSQMIIDAFSKGANATYVINNVGDVLISYDSDMIKKATNLSNNYFEKKALNNPDVLLSEHYKDANGDTFLYDAHSIPDFNIIVISKINADIVFEGINATTRRNIYLSLVIWFLSILFLWFFSKSISNPLRELKDAVDAIENGNYHVSLHTRGSDEAGILTDSVQSMSNVLINFERFTNKSLAKLSRRGLLTTSGASKEATIFFSDIRGFTSISEKLTAEGVVEFLNDYMELMVACVLNTGGAIDKFIGDAVMAHWGAEESSGSFERDAFNGVRSALMMRACLMSFNKYRGSVSLPIIKIGCGLNSGIVVAGQIGSEQRVAYTVIGPSVTFAERCESLNKPLGTEIIISEYTHNLVGKFFITEEIQEVTEDNARIKLFAVINVRGEENGEKILRDLKSIPGTDPQICKKCVGIQGPHTLSELRNLLDIAEPDLSALNLDKEEKKYSV
ncbi:MAG: adenylate/guanylate cyclase domain-containing protein [Termitinemataceae bacterium]|nr:MAG: adenylate/guanylate cyclase domain-containing protein [Termitinemataceae bacterium]